MKGVTEAEDRWSSTGVTLGGTAFAPRARKIKVRQSEQVTQATMCQGFTCSPHCLKRLKLRFLLPGRWGPRATAHRLTQSNPGAPTPSKGAKVNTHTHAHKSKHMMGIHANTGRLFPSLCAEKTVPNRQIVLKLAQIKVRSPSYSATDDGEKNPHDPRDIITATGLEERVVNPHNYQYAHVKRVSFSRMRQDYQK